MAHWNHRVVKRIVSGEVWFGIHECFYGLDGEGEAWTDEPKAVEGESIDDLRETLHRMLAALDKPVIDDTN